MTLEFDGIQFGYNENSLLSGIYVKCETGKITGLVGRNGSGKSTLLKIVFGALRSDGMSVRINGDYVEPPAFLKQKISYLPQNNLIPPNLTLMEILSLYKINKAMLAVNFPELLEVLDKKRDQLSGGTVRLFENLVVLFSPSPFCFFDEPFTGLSPIMIEKLIHSFSQEKRSKGILVTDHMYRHVMDIADTLCLLKDGKTYQINSIEDLIQRGYLLFE